MRILIVLPAQDRATGNWVTAERFGRGLRARGHVVNLFAACLDPQPLARAVSTFAPDVALLLHAFRSGQPWLEVRADIPFLVLLTGTDLNQGLDDPRQGPLIRRVLAESAGILLQNPLLRDAFEERLPGLAARLQLLPPAVELGSAPCPLRSLHHLPADRPLLLFPAGVRPVKGQMEFLDMVLPIAAELPPFHIAFCGPVLEAGYGSHFLEALKRIPWSTYIGVIPPEAMASAMRQCDLLLNHSRSEGLPNALLEAATLGLPILARNIPGNAAVVRHGINGMLYGDAAEFAMFLRRLLADPESRKLLSNPTNAYTPHRESDHLSAACVAALKNSRGPSDR